MGLDEDIMVVPREKLFGANNERLFEGFRTVKEAPDFLKIINESHTFIIRRDAEENVNFLQIIPYIIIRNKDKFFVMHYLGGTNDKRHLNQYNLGVGGHMNPVKEGNALIRGAEKEFFEEVTCKTKFNPQVLGFINNESDMYNKVHFGVVFLQKVDTDVDITQEEKHKMAGEMMTVSEMRSIYDRLGFWSKSVFDRIELFL